MKTIHLNEYRIPNTKYLIPYRLRLAQFSKYLARVNCSAMAIGYDADSTGPLFVLPDFQRRAPFLYHKAWEGHR